MRKCGHWAFYKFAANQVGLALEMSGKILLGRDECLGGHLQAGYHDRSPLHFPREYFLQRPTYSVWRDWFFF